MYRPSLLRRLYNEAMFNLYGDEKPDSLVAVELIDASVPPSSLRNWFAVAVRLNHSRFDLLDASAAEVITSQSSIKLKLIIAFYLELVLSRVI